MGDTEDPGTGSAGTALSGEMSSGEASDVRPGWRLGPRGLVSVGLLAFGLRAAYIAQVWAHPAVRVPVIDAEAYRLRALQILEGDWLGSAVYYLDPLYPFFLAAIYAFLPPDSMGVLLVQAALDSVSVVLLMTLARRVFDGPTALGAGLLAATYEPFFFYDALLLKAPLMIFLIVVALCFVTRAAERDRLSSWWPAGFFLGLAALTRGNSLLFAPVLGAWLLAFGQGDVRRRALAVGVLGLGLVCAIAPVSLRNYLVGDDLVLLNSQAGQNFYIGHFEGNDTGAYRAPPFLRPNPVFEEEDFAREARRLTGQDMKPSEISSFWLSQGLDAIAADPVRFLRHSLQKTLVLFNHYEIPDNASMEYFETEVSPMLALPFPGYALILPLSVGGLLLSYRRPLCVVLALFVFSYSAGILLFFNLSRLRLPIVPVLILFAAYALVTGIERLRTRNARGLAVPVMAVAAFFGITQLDLVHQNLNVRYLNMGVGFLERSERSWAESRALQAAGDPAGAARAVERAFDDRGLAEAQFERGLEHDPDYRRLAEALRHSMLTRVLHLNELDRSAEALEAAIVLANRYPDEASGFVVLGRAYERLDRLGPARNAYQRALRIDPGNLAARRGLHRIQGGR